jgi:hypothetical protein
MYANINEAFSSGMEELDEMAYKMNENTKKQLSRDVYQDVEKQFNTAKIRVQEVHDKITPESISKTNIERPFKYYSPQGNIAEGIDDVDHYEYIMHGTNVNTLKNNKDLDSVKSVDKDISPKEYKTLLKELIRKDLEVQRVTQNKVDTLMDIVRDHHITDKMSPLSLEQKLEHIKICHQCKKQFLTLISTQDNHIFNKGYNKISDEYHYRAQPISSSITHSTAKPENSTITPTIESFTNLFARTNIKELVVAILVGIIIILLLDAYKKSKKN